jgi:guanosine-3',5'-bis(diphosphate) 3'-pyrophosphohydrolase
MQQRMASEALGRGEPMKKRTTPAWQQAATFAARMHHGQTRKDGRTPYIAHPFRVAMTVRDVFGVDDPVALAAALLHDVIEDTTADYDDLEKRFGTAVADVVAALTKDMRMREDEREAAYDRQLAAAPWQARLVKLADVYDNVSDCLDDEMRQKAVAKAVRAVKLAGNDPPQVKAASLKVQELLAHACRTPRRRVRQPAGS